MRLLSLLECGGSPAAHVHPLPPASHRPLWLSPGSCVCFNLTWSQSLSSHITVDKGLISLWRPQLLIPGEGIWLSLHPVGGLDRPVGCSSQTQPWGQVGRAWVTCEYLSAKGRGGERWSTLQESAASKTRASARGYDEDRRLLFKRKNLQ